MFYFHSYSGSVLNVINCTLLSLFLDVKIPRILMDILYILYQTRVCEGFVLYKRFSSLHNKEIFRKQTVFILKGYLNVTNNSQIFEKKFICFIKFYVQGKKRKRLTMFYKIVIFIVFKMHICNL